MCEGCKVWWCCVEDAQSGTNRAFLDKGKPTNVFAPSFFVDGAAWWCLVRLFFGADVFVESRALRVFPAETRLTVYRRHRVLPKLFG